MWGVSLVTIFFIKVSSVISSNPCDLKFDAGPCRGIKHVVAFEDGQCVSKVFGGCKGNDNKFSSIEDCEKTCASKLEKKFSPTNPTCLKPAVETSRRCRGMFPRFTFNSDVGKCEEIVYGGCGATDNMFLTMEDCVGVCMTEDNIEDESEESSEEEDDDDDNIDDHDDVNVCELPPISPGLISCMAFIKKWTFSQSDGKCVPYIYGGCRGTRNLFDTEDECVTTCPQVTSRSLTADVCSLPLQARPCKAVKQMFGFNKETGRCEAFNYGGCKGNDNRFSSIEQCVNTCGGLSDPVITPLINNKCENVKCDAAESFIKISQGCSPITQPGDCCPSSWECSSWQARMSHTDKCWFEGKLYNPGESISPSESNKNACQVGCMCHLNNQGLAEINCAHVDCFPPPEFDWFNCRPRYTQGDTCCASEYTCGPDLETLATCQMDNKTYYEGELMYPEADPCVTCHCQQGWDGNIKGQFCTKTHCDLNLDGDKLVRGCKPVFQPGVCCHVDWVCPLELETTEAVIIEAKAAIKPDDKCLLPKQVGPCKMNKDMYYFDLSTRKCSLFQYGGCKGNENQFATLEECENVCREYMVARYIDDNNSRSRCEQEKSSGKCRGFMTKYYYNKAAGKCQQFVYTGCQGNDNRFDSIDECEATCHVIQDTSAKNSKDANTCEQPVMIGRCKSRLEKFYYDKTTGRCNKFYYSGCGGGSNMFDTSEECQQSCVTPETMSRALIKQDLFVSSPCDQDMDKGPCRAAKPRWFYNKVNMKCQEFLYGGCRGNDNNFETQEACEDRCVVPRMSSPIDVSVLLPPVGKVTLPEKAQPPMMIGGPRPGVTCPGCPTQTSVTPEIKMVAGHGVTQLATVSNIGHSSQCDNKIVLKHINDVRKQVVAGTNYIFTLTLETRTGAGCDKVQRQCSGIYIHKPLGCGKENIAQCLSLIRPTEISCQEHDDTIMAPDMREVPGQVSSDEEYDPCMLEKRVGRCRASLNRWYFNTGSKTCERFRYGGCMGNDNNFPDSKTCEQKCGHHMTSVRPPRVLRPTPGNPVCQLPMEAGPCYALKPRFFFNFETRRCEQFIYGGCRGNKNNFGSMEECISSCGKHPRGGALLIQQPQEERCQFGNKTYALGDMIRLPGDQCKTCVCSSPPDMTCIVKKCPLSSFIPPAGGVNCVMQQDEYGCCDTGYKCQHVPSPTPPPTGGSYPVLGGYSSNEAIGHEQKLIAGVATKSFLSQVAGVTGDQCDHLTLLNIVTFQRQIVAGTNFRLSLRLRTKSGSGCSEIIEKTCDNIVLFKPLPYACTPSKENSHCLSLSNTENINCYN